MRLACLLLMWVVMVISVAVLASCSGQATAQQSTQKITCTITKEK